VRGGRENARAVLAGRPHVIGEPERPQYAQLVTAACGSPDPALARAAVGQLPSWIQWTPDVTGLLVGALTDLADHHVWPVVPPVVGALLDHPSGAATLDAALTALIRLDDADRAPGGPPHDRPARRRLERVAEQAEWWAHNTPADTDREPVREVARRLATHPAFVPQAAGLLAALLRPDTPEPDRLTELADLIANRPVLADRLGGSIRGQSSDLDVLLARATALAHRTDPAAGLIAAGLATAGRDRGWPEPWRLLVGALRAHPAADVRDAAYAITMASQPA
jgi:hypothetical protein